MSRTASRRVIARVVAAKLLAEPTRRKHWLRATAAYLLEHGLQDDADMLTNDIARELFRREGLLLSNVTTARRLSESLRTDISRELRAATGAKHIVMKESVDSNLLGGFIARTPEAEYDASVRTQLQQLAALGEV